MIHQHLLEATLQGGVLFDVLAVLVEGGGANAAQFPPGQHRLEQIAGIHGSTGGASAHHRVDFIDEQHDLAFRGGDLLEHSFEPFLELTAVFRTGDQGSHVEGDELTVLQGLGHIAIHDALRQSLNNGGLADPGFADQHGVVFGAPAEDLDGAPDLLVATDHRVQLSVTGGGRQVPSVLLKRFIGPFRVLIGHRLVASHGCNGFFEFAGVNARLAEQLPAAAFIVGQGQQQMFDGDVAVTESIAGCFGAIQAAVEGASQKHRFRWRAKTGLLPEMAVDGRLERANVDPCFAENASSQTVLLQQRKQQMLRFKLLMPGALRQLLGGDDGGPGLFGELFRRGLHLGCVSTGFTVWGLFRFQWGQTEAFGSVPTPGSGKPGCLFRVCRTLGCQCLISRWWTPSCSRAWRSQQRLAVSWNAAVGWWCMSTTTG